MNTARRTLEKYENSLESAPRLKPLCAHNWASTVPREAGVYAIWIKKKPVYVGQTSSLRARMADLARPVNHTFSRKTCEQLGLAETSLEEFSIAVSSKYTLSFVQVPIGRAELEEYLVLRWRESLTNKPAARLLKSPQYSWVVAV